jgi:hypothetical protein
MQTNEPILEPAAAARTEVDAAGAPERHPFARATALTMLVATASALGWLAIAVVQIFTDSWIAPIQLSPDSDAVLSVNLELTRQRAEIGRVEAEVARFEAEITAIDAGLARLRSIRDRGRAMFEYGAEIRGSEAASLVEQIAHLRDEREIVDRLIERQRTETERARANLTAGLIERRDAEREEQSLDNLLLRRVEIERSLGEAEARRREAREAESEFRAELGVAATEPARMPEIVAREEADVRLEVEVLRLEAERRGLVALLDVGRRSLGELHDVMAQIEARPAFRATTEAMSVAFVPYEQLEGVTAGARIIDCEMGIFLCRDVGSIRDVLAGEIVTQDPWGELARGRYAVLDLTDPVAVEERILRVR